MKDTKSSAGKMDIYFKGIVHDIVINLWVIILAIIIVEMVSYVYMDKIYEEKYESTVVYCVNLKQKPITAYNNTVMSALMASQMKTALENSGVMVELEKSFSNVNIRKAINIQNIANTNILEISVVAPSAELSFQILKKFISLKDTISDSVFSNGELIEVEKPEVSPEPINSVNVMYMLIVVKCLTLIAMILLVGYLSYSKDTIKGEFDIKTKIDTNLIATIYHEKTNNRANVKKGILLSDNTISNSFEESFNRIRVKLEYLAHEKNYKTFLFSSVEENEGKTTVSVNVALSLAKKGYKVLIMDADLRKPALYKILSLAKKKDKEWAKYINNINLEFDKYLDYLPQYNLYTLYNTKSYKNSMEIVSSENMQLLLKACKERMDFIIVDTPPLQLVADTEIIAQFVDASVLIVRQDMVDIKDVNDYIDILDESKSELIGCVFNNVEGKQKDNFKKSYY